MLELPTGLELFNPHENDTAHAQDKIPAMPTFDQYIQDEFAPDNKYVQDEFVPDNIPDDIRNLSQKPATQEHEDEEEKHLINKFTKLNKDQLIQELLEIEQEKSDAVHSGSKNSEDEQDNDNIDDNIDKPVKDSNKMHLRPRTKRVRFN